MTNPNLTPYNDAYSLERKFVGLAKKIAEENEKSRLVLFAYNQHCNLYRFSQKCRAGDLEARKLWDMLPETIREFWPSLNYLNQERSH